MMMFSDNIDGDQTGDSPVNAFDLQSLKDYIEEELETLKSIYEEEDIIE